MPTISFTQRELHQLLQAVEDYHFLGEGGDSELFEDWDDGKKFRLAHSIVTKVGSAAEKCGALDRNDHFYPKRSKHLGR